MSLSEPTIMVSCDNPKCHEEDELSMTALARGSWDDRHAESEAKRYGWIWVSDSEHYCSEECHENATAKEDSN